MFKQSRKIFLSHYYRIMIALFVIAGTMTSLSPVLAQELSVDTAVALDESTVVSKGYSVTSQNGGLMIGIAPGIFSESTLVEIKAANTEGTIVPENLQLISDAYIYNIRMLEPAVTVRPLWLRLQYTSDSAFRKRPYFWNRVTSTWQELPARLDAVNSTLTFPLHFPYTQVAVFEDTSRTDAPVNLHASPPPAVVSGIALVVDNRTGEVLYEKNANKEWWPASLTKLMTALVFLETKPDLQQVVSYDNADNAIGSKLYVKHGETMRLRDVFETMLVGSANNATNTVVRNSGMTENAFLARMNAKAKEIGMTHTTFIDFSGLSTENKTTARDMALLTQNAARVPEIFTSTNRLSYYFATLNTGMPHSIKTTNKVDLPQRALVKKTGYLDESGYQFVTHLVDSPGNEFTIAIMDASSSAIRFNDAKALAQWVKTAWEWK